MARRQEGTGPSVAIDNVVLVTYDASWPARFDEAAREIRSLLDENLRIEHIGSTAVPGMKAKPIIDILVEVADSETARDEMVPKLLAAGYFEIYWRFDWPPGHFQCVKRDPATFRRLIHLHLAPPGHPLWRTVEFRDHLRTHPEAAAEYAQLKSDLARRFENDREAYAAAKSAYFDALP